MIKHYSSDSHIALNVVLKNGKSTHISFIPLSNGGSVFSTDIKDIQDGLERHYRFGSLFTLIGTENENTVEENDTVNVAETADSEDTDTNGLRKIKVSDIGEAKDYLADTFGISRTSLRGMKSILEAAETHKIVFEGL